MKAISVCGGLKVSQYVIGFMRFKNKTVEQAEDFIQKALECGINCIDNADIYGGGECEKLLGRVFEKRPSLREKLVVQTKCGICRGFYDLSKEHILRSVDTSLGRMNIMYIDILLLHRPDALMDYKEVADALKTLFFNGKVHYFGVSNFSPIQIDLLQKELPFKLWFNQIQFSVVHCQSIDESVHFNTTHETSLVRDGNVLDYCALHDIQVQAWSPLQVDFVKGTFINNPEYKKLNEKLCELSQKYDVTPHEIALSWILRHPSHIQVVTGTTNPEHLVNEVSAFSFELTRKEWYELYLSTGKPLP
ncbi:aryl-alcohol dehydrogenase, putative [Entamoeba invadens IP1]|uniref:aryl-alcohol dehydrogenase, putative n=1 Tax=Entamoeba invadens IP1 TaxID=370355 RepID=UPI0002C3D21A|nr:aryl-alcohol dehydrogenase, putative [Entamoeba invadens IP1]ELP93423.1 aryl-alcohol dehydrogenase, putative [Entamoeba invadens IP1]|eukprot:XP_004260194.1 aryl-alcohol dehydrogenase, putative [Entamoeba invadens IP1]